MVASGLRTMIAGSLSSCIAGFRRSWRSSRSSVPRRWFVGIGPAFAALGRDTFASNSKILRRLLQRPQNASVFAQGCADLSFGSANRLPKFARYLGWTSSSIRSDLVFGTHSIRNTPGSATHSQSGGADADRHRVIAGEAWICRTWDFAALGRGNTPEDVVD
jgi:hypothetical protein